MSGSKAHNETTVNESSEMMDAGAYSSTNNSPSPYKISHMVAKGISEVNSDEKEKT